MTELSQDQLQGLARSYFRDLLIDGNDLVFRIENDLLCHPSEREAERLSWAKDAQKKEQRIRELDADGSAASIFNGHTKQLLLRNEHPVSASSDSFGILAQYVVRAEIEARRVLKAKLYRNYPEIAAIDPLFSGILDDTLPPMPEFGLSAPETDITTAKAVEKFKTANAKKWIYKTGLDFERMLGCFVEWFGPNKSLRSVTTTAMGEYRDALKLLPKNWKKNKNGPKTFHEAIKNAANAPALKPQSAEKYLNLTKAFLNWCVDEGYIDKVPGKKLSIEYTVDDKARYPFDAEQLKAIFHSPVWTGCFSRSRRSRTGSSIFENAYYWIPLVGVYAGMRCGEIVQLRQKDIKTLDGIAYIDVNDEVQKKLKTKYSTRRIPIHPKLIEWGFLDFVSTRKAGSLEERVFHEIKITKKGDPSHAYSKAFSRYLIDISLKNSKLSFHSYRHTFSDACTNSSITDGLTKMLMGHSDGSASAQYGSGASIPVLFEAISKIKYAFEDSFVPAKSAHKNMVGA